MHLSEDIHNLMERLLTEELTLNPPAISGEQLADLCCLVLNKVPPRYVRHDVDNAYFTTEQEKQQLERKIRVAITESLDFLTSRDVRY